MQLTSILWLLLAVPFLGNTQEGGTVDGLLQEAESKLYTQPEQSGKIAEYVLGQNENLNLTIAANLLLAKSFYVRGDYDEAVKYSLEAMRKGDLSSNIELKVKTKIFTIQLLRDLGLTTVADDYFQELSLLRNKISDDNFSRWVSAHIEQDKATVSFENDEISEAIQFLKKAKESFLESNDKIAVSAVDINLAQAFLRSHKPDSAKIYLEKHRESQSGYHRLRALFDLGMIYFEDKDFRQSVAFFKSALTQSQNLPNREYEYKSAVGLTQAYLALDDSHNFLIYKQKANVLSTQIDIDKSLAINSVYNFINSNQNELITKKTEKGYMWIYSLIGILLLLLIVGILINYLYTSKTKEYRAIYKYISPKETKPLPKPHKEVLDKSSIVSEETEQILLKKLDKFESGKAFTSSDMSIAFLASKMETNTKYLSEVINRQKGKNFNTYINELRINYIIEKLKTDPTYFNYKISYLAQESGFSSHSSFATVFKSVTGISPTKFMDYLQKQQEVS